MINEAIKKIDEEISSGDYMVKELGAYVKERLLTSDSNAGKILEPDRELDTFAERLAEIASEIHKSGKTKDTAAEFSRKIIAIVKGIKPKDAEADEEIGRMFLKVVEEQGHSSLCLSSEQVIPLLHIYYGISADPAPEKKAEPRRGKFRMVSLD